jgi:hypothetical protein
MSDPIVQKKHQIQHSCCNHDHVSSHNQRSSCFLLRIDDDLNSVTSNSCVGVSEKLSDTVNTSNEENTENDPKDNSTDNLEEDTTGYVLPDDMSFPKASVDPILLKLQKEVTEFVTSVILKHEGDLYDLMKKQFPDQLEDILGLTTNKIISMITLLTNNFYNKLYFDVQNKVDSKLVDLVNEMSEFAKYGPHILLDKIIRITYHVHLDVDREKLQIDNKDIYLKCVLQDINLSLLSFNLLHVLSKGPDDDTPFAIVPKGELPFNIIVEKNLQI